MTKTISAHQRLRAEHLVSQLERAKEECLWSAGDVPLFIWSAAHAHYSHLIASIKTALSSENERLEHHIEMAEINLDHFRKYQAAA